MASTLYTRRRAVSAMPLIAVPVPLGAHGSTAIPPIEVMRREYRRLYDTVNANYVDGDPETERGCERMTELETLIIGRRSISIEDARAKLRFAVELEADGLSLDVDSAAEVLADLARHILP